MAPLTSLQSRGGGRIPTAGGSLSLSRHALGEVVQQLALELYPHKGYHAALAALQAHPEAAQLIREAAAAYLAAPAAPALAPAPLPRRRMPRVA